jgi:hypothetical protein
MSTAAFSAIVITATTVSAYSAVIAVFNVAATFTIIATAVTATAAISVSSTSASNWLPHLNGDRSSRRCWWEGR